MTAPRKRYWPRETTARRWIALAENDQEALTQLLERAERAGEIKPLIDFIRTLLKQAGEPAIVRNQKQADRRNSARRNKKR